MRPVDALASKKQTKYERKENDVELDIFNMKPERIQIFGSTDEWILEPQNLGKTYQFTSAGAARHAAEHIERLAQHFASGVKTSITEDFELVVAILAADSDVVGDDERLLGKRIDESFRILAGAVLET